MTMPISHQDIKLSTSLVLYDRMEHPIKKHVNHVNKHRLNIDLKYSFEIMIWFDDDVDSDLNGSDGDDHDGGYGDDDDFDDDFN